MKNETEELRRELRSPFGEALRFWRSKKGLSQIEVALRANSTPRYISFVETGRSRPSHEFVMRLTRALDLSLRNTNSLLRAAGFRPAFDEFELCGEEAQSYRDTIDLILSNHMPYPACVFDPLCSVRLCNDGFRAFFPGMEEMSPETHVDEFFGKRKIRRRIENWNEIAWNWIDRQRLAASSANNEALEALVDRAERLMVDEKRPSVEQSRSLDVISPVFLVGSHRIETIVSVMRFESAREVTLSELRVELLFPRLMSDHDFFVDLVENYQRR